MDSQYGIQIHRKIAELAQTERHSRSSKDIIAAMIRASGLGVKKTQIMYKANLSYDMLKRYLKILVVADLVQNRSDGYYYSTPRGFEYVKEYDDLIRIRKDYEEKSSVLDDLVPETKRKRST